MGYWRAECESKSSTYQTDYYRESQILLLDIAQRDMLCKLADRFHYPVYARNLGCGVMSLDVEPSGTVAKGVPHGMIHAIIHFNSEHPFKVFTKATSYGRVGELDGLQPSRVSTRELVAIEQALKDYPEDGVDDVYAALGLKASDAEKSVTYGSTS